MPPVQDGQLMQGRRRTVVVALLQGRYTVLRQRATFWQFFLFSFLLPLVTLRKKMTGKGLPAVRKELFALGGGSLRPPLFQVFFSFFSFCNLLGVSCTCFSNHPFAYTEIYIYSARVSSRVEIKFQSNSFFSLKFEFV